MSHPIRFLLAAALAAIIFGGGMNAQSTAAALFQQGLMLERAEGKVQEAIFLYERVVADYPDDARITPQALYHLGRTYQRRQDPRASVLLNRLVRQFPDASPFADDARSALVELEQTEGGAFRSVPISPPDGVAYTVAPDGRSFAYVRADPSNEERRRIFVRPLQGGRERLLIELDDTSFPRISWAPTSDRLAVGIVNSTAATAELRLLDTSNAGGRVLDSLPALPNSGPAAMLWSPDGRWIVWTAVTPPGAATAAPLRLVNVSSGERREIGQTRGTPRWIWAPDSTRVAAFLVEGTGPARLRILAMAGGDARTLQMPVPDRNGELELTRWTTGDEVRVGVPVPPLGFDFYLVPVDGVAPRKVCEGRGSSGGAGCQSMMPDGGSQIRREADHLFVENIASGERIPLTTASGQEQSVLPLSPDGKLAIVRSNRSGRWALYVTPTDRGPVAEPALLAYLDGTPPTNAESAQAWWGTSGRLALHMRSEGSDIYRVDVDPATGRPAGPAERLTHDSPSNSLPSISPDSQRVSFWYENGTKKGIAIMDADGSHERPVLEHAFPQGVRDSRGVNGRPVSRSLWWRSPTEVLFHEFRPAAGTRLGYRALNVTTGVTTAIPHGEHDGGWPWIFVPGRNGILYGNELTIGQSPRELRMRSLTDGSDELVATIPEPWVHTISADGRLLAYSRAVHLPSEAGGNQWQMELRLRTMDESGTDTLLRPGAADTNVEPQSFSPDGKFLVYNTEDATNGSQTFVMNLDTFEEVPIVDKTADTPFTYWTSAVWSPDGTFIVLARASARTEWRAWEGVTYDAVAGQMDAAPRR